VSVENFQLYFPVKELHLFAITGMYTATSRVKLASCESFLHVYYFSFLYTKLEKILKHTEII